MNEFTLADAITTKSDTKYKRGQRTEVELRQIHARVAWLALKPYLEGHWQVTREHDDESNVCRYLEVERTDGVRLYISVAAGWYEDQTRLTFSAGTYKEPSGSQIDLKWLLRQDGDGYLAPDRTPTATVSIVKRKPEAIAADITRRVIEPLEAALPKIRARQSADAERVAQIAATVATLSAIPGMQVHEDKRANVGGLRFEIGHSGEITMDKVNVHRDDVARVVEFMTALAAARKAGR